MKRKLNHSVFFRTLILLGCILLLAGKPSLALNFDSFTLEDGLPGNLVYCIKQDSYGWVWIGTDQGLSKFDGYRFVNFLPSTKDSSSIKGLHIRAIHEDKRGNLWVATELGGLNLFDRAKEVFLQPFEKELQFESMPLSILDIKEDEAGNLWVVSKKRIFIIDSLGKVSDITEIGFEDIYDQIDLVIQKIEFDKAGNVWIATRSSLFAINMKSKSITKFDSICHVLNLFLDSKGKIWASTNLHGLFVIDPVSMNAELIKLKPEYERNYSIRQVTEDSSGDFWISTRGGLYCYNTNDKSSQHYYHDEREPSSILSNSVISLFIDKNEEMWIGTRQGLNLLLKRKQMFQNFRAHPSDITKKYLNSKGIYALWVDKDENTWVGTEDGGINILNKNSQQYTYLTNEKNNPNSISENCIKAFLDDKKGNLWVATFLGGIDIINLKTGKIRNHKNDPENPKSLISNEVWGFAMDKDGGVWIATTLGVDKYDPTSDSFIHQPKLIENERVNWISNDSKNNLWLGTNKEVIIYSLYNNSIIRHKENSFSFLEDSKGRYWITTFDTGLAQYSIENGAVGYYNKQEGMSSNHTFCILEDNDQFLWITSSYGLTRFDPENQAFINFNKNDGILNNVFRYGAAFKTADGNLMFGNIAGFIKFNPKDILIDTNPAPIVLTELRVMNRIVEIGNDENSILKKSLNLTDHIELNYNQNALSFEFAVLNYSAGSNEYSYILEGFDHEWSVPSNNRIAIYNNLQPGEYTLRVCRVVNNTRLFNNELQFSIKIRPPFWKTLWFRIITFIFIFIFLNFIILFFIYRERTKMELMLERMKTKKENELNNLKLKFFTNISHEIRTPLTLILTPLEKLRSKKVPTEDINSYLEIIHRNAKNLYDLINQLLDFRKLDTGNLVLELNRGNIVQTISQIVDSYQSFAIEKRIHLKLHSFANRMIVFYDAGVVRKILNNLLSNSFKFTRSEGKISVYVSVVFNPEQINNTNGQLDKGFIEISVSDTGIGIPDQNMEKIFDRFYQSNDQEYQTGSGIGLSFVKELVMLHNGSITVESIPDKGSKFIIRIPYMPDDEDCDQEAFVEKEGSESLVEEINLHSLSKHVMLVVEDNPDVRLLIRDHFKDSFQIYEANNGQEGWALSLKYVPDIIISDVLMPDMNGFEFCNKVKTDERTSHIPFLLLTALHSKENEIKGLEYGANDYITKPFDLIVMQNKIENILSVRDSYKEKYSATMMLKPRDIIITSPDQKFLQKAIDVVEKHIGDPDLDLEQFVAEVGVSRMQLYRKLHALTDMTVKEFIRDIRLKRAAQLLAQDTITVSEVAYAVGFKDVSHFGKCFRQVYGVNASEYKRSILKNNGDHFVDET